MSIQVQHYIVYLAVGFAFYQLFSPIFSWLLNKYKKWKNPMIQEDPYSCYTGSCGRCSVKENS